MLAETLVTAAAVWYLGRPSHKSASHREAGLRKPVGLETARGLEDAQWTSRTAPATSVVEGEGAYATNHVLVRA